MHPVDLTQLASWKHLDDGWTKLQSHCSSSYDNTVPYYPSKKQQEAQKLQPQWYCTIWRDDMKQDQVALSIHFQKDLTDLNNRFDALLTKFQQICNKEQCNLKTHQDAVTLLASVMLLGNLVDYFQSYLAWCQKHPLDSEAGCSSAIDFHEQNERNIQFMLANTQRIEFLMEYFTSGTVRTDQVWESATYWQKFKYYTNKLSQSVIKVAKAVAAAPTEFLVGWFVLYPITKFGLGAVAQSYRYIATRILGFGVITPEQISGFQLESVSVFFQLLCQAAQGPELLYVFVLTLSSIVVQSGFLKRFWNWIKETKKRLFESSASRKALFAEWKQSNVAAWSWAKNPTEMASIVAKKSLQTVTGSETKTATLVEKLAGLASIQSNAQKTLLVAAVLKLVPKLCEFYNAIAGVVPPVNEELRKEAASAQAELNDLISKGKLSAENVQDIQSRLGAEKDLGRLKTEEESKQAKGFFGVLWSYAPTQANYERQAAYREAQAKREEQEKKVQELRNKTGTYDPKLDEALKKYGQLQQHKDFTLSHLEPGVAAAVVKQLETGETVVYGTDAPEGSKAASWQASAAQLAGWQRQIDKLLSAENMKLIVGFAAGLFVCSVVWQAFVDLFAGESHSGLIPEWDEKSHFQVDRKALHDSGQIVTRLQLHTKAASYRPLDLTQEEETRKWSETLQLFVKRILT